MKKSNENKIIHEIKSGINTTENFRKILDKHSGIFFKMCSKYMYGNFHFYQNDFLPNRESFIYECVLDYKPDKGAKFSTYLASRIKWFCLNLYNKNKESNTKKVNIDQEDLNNIACSNTSIISLEKKDALEEFLKKLKGNKDLRLYEIFKLRYLDGEKNTVMPWSVVAQSPKVNLSVQGCINVHNKYIEKIRKEKK